MSLILRKDATILWRDNREDGAQFCPIACSRDRIFATQICGWLFLSFLLRFSVIAWRPLFPISCPLSYLSFDTMQCGNPMYLGWIEEWMEHARENNNKSYFIYRKVNAMHCAAYELHFSFFRFPY